MNALISSCGTWRYTLPRDKTIDTCNHSALVCALLNPSTADTDIHDPTDRRVMGYAARERCHGSIIINLYALRATDPRELWRHPDPVGPQNDFFIDWVLSRAQRCVVGWGTHARPDRVKRFVEIANRQSCELVCLGVNKDGSPKHPLYLRKDAPLIPWSLPT